MAEGFAILDYVDETITEKIQW